MNGQEHASRSHVFTVGKTRIKLSRGWITKAREIYSNSMQVKSIACGCCFYSLSAYLVCIEASFLNGWVIFCFSDVWSERQCKCSCKDIVLATTKGFNFLADF